VLDIYIVLAQCPIISNGIKVHGTLLSCIVLGMSAHTVIGDIPIYCIYSNVSYTSGMLYTVRCKLRFITVNGVEYGIYCMQCSVQAMFTVYGVVYLPGLLYTLIGN
jgi:hypothetical protein